MKRTPIELHIARASDPNPGAKPETPKLYYFLKDLSTELIFRSVSWSPGKLYDLNPKPRNPKPQSPKIPQTINPNPYSTLIEPFKGNLISPFKRNPLKRTPKPETPKQRLFRKSEADGGKKASTCEIMRTVASGFRVFVQGSIRVL